MKFENTMSHSNNDVLLPSKLIAFVMKVETVRKVNVKVDREEKEALEVVMKTAD